MFFDYKGILQEDASAANEPNDIDQLLPQDPSTEEGLNNIANQIEDAMQQQALEHADYFENGEEAINEFFNSPEIKAIMEADTTAVMPAGNAAKRRTIVLLNKRDDLTRRARLGSLMSVKILYSISLLRIVSRSVLFVKQSSRSMVKKLIRLLVSLRRSIWLSARSSICLCLNLAVVEKNLLTMISSEGINHLLLINSLPRLLHIVFSFHVLLPSGRDARG